MIRVEPLPGAFGRHHAMGGVLDYAQFDDVAEDDEATAIAAIGALLGDGFDGARLSALGRRSIDKASFFGRSYDPARRLLLKRGHYVTEDGRELVDSVLKMLDDVTIVGGSHGIPEAGSGGEFAYAFSMPPYPLAARPSEIQAAFDDVCALVLPPWTESAISDWSSAELPGVHDYFRMGMEWWGVFLFSIHTPALRRLTIIAGSTTD